MAKMICKRMLGVTLVVAMAVTAFLPVDLAKATVDEESIIEKQTDGLPDFDEVFSEKELEKAEDELRKKADKDMAFSVRDCNVSNNYADSVKGVAPNPTKKGLILVTTDKLYGIFKLGHSAIVYDKNRVIESTYDLDTGTNGVTYGGNSWTGNRHEVYVGKVKNLNDNQLASAANYCRDKVGTPYNFDFRDINTRKRFYCSQLVYAAFLDKHGINLNTDLFSDIKGNPVHPVELVTSSNTAVVQHVVDGKNVH